MTCSITGCEARRKARGMCMRHYVAWTRDPSTPRGPRPGLLPGGPQNEARLAASASAFIARNRA